MALYQVTKVSKNDEIVLTVKANIDKCEVCQHVQTPSVHVQFYQSFGNRFKLQQEKC